LLGSLLILASLVLLLSDCFVESFASHLASSNNVFIWMNSHCHNVFFVLVEELLHIIYLHNTDTGSCEDNIVVRVISQISSGIETSESMGPV
jgi:hypothetical protein